MRAKKDLPWLLASAVWTIHIKLLRISHDGSSVWVPETPNG